MPPCTVHRETLADAESGLEVCAACAGSRRTVKRVVEAWPAEAGRFAADARAVPPHNPSCRRLVKDGRPRILSPAGGSEYRLEAAIEREQKLFFTAMASGAALALHWFVDGSLVASSPPAARVPWRLVRGEHEVRCVDDRGRGTAVTIRVR